MAMHFMNFYGTFSFFLPHNFPQNHIRRFPSPFLASSSPTPSTHYPGKRTRCHEAF